LPTARLPTRLSRPRYFAPLSVPIVIASSGVKPDSTSNSQLPLIRIAGNDAATAGRIGAGDEHAAGFRERVLEHHHLGEEFRVDARPRGRGGLRVALLELRLQIGQEHVEARRFSAAPS